MGRLGSPRHVRQTKIFGHALNCLTWKQLGRLYLDQGRLAFQLWVQLLWCHWFAIRIQMGSKATLSISEKMGIGILCESNTCFFMLEFGTLFQIIRVLNPLNYWIVQSTWRDRMLVHDVKPNKFTWHNKRGRTDLQNCWSFLATS